MLASPRGGGMRPTIASKSGLRSRPATAGIDRRRTGARARVEHGEVELILGGVEVDEEIVDFVQHRGGPRIGAVDLVDDDDRRETTLERLAEDEPRLRKRPFRCVDEQQHAVDHDERPLYLAAEVRVAGCVDDVDEDLAPRAAAVPDRRVLGEDRDAPLALEIGVVERALGDPLVGAEHAALVQERVNERRLAVVDVRDDGHVAEQRVRDRRWHAARQRF